MQRANDKYGRGSAAVNGAGFVDLEPGDTFDRLDALLRGRIRDQFENAMLGLRASIASKRNANELAKHLAYGEKEEVHKFAAKNIGALFERGGVAIRHLDKKAVVGQRWIVVYVRVFSSFVFADRRFVATITLKESQKGAGNIYAVEALEINQDADSERTPRGAIPKGLNSAPIQNLASQLVERIAYYVGDVNRTKPAFVARSEAFSVEAAAELVLNTVLHQPPTASHQSPITDIAVIILIGQEKIHLRRCIEKLASLNPRQIVLVESQPDDGGVAIAKETAAKVGLRLETVYHKWPGNQAVQFNWALDAICVGGRCRCTEEVSGFRFQVSGGEVSWILRLDADEYLTEQTCEKLKQALCGAAGVRALPDDVVGLTLELKRRFMGGEIRHATNGIRQVRIFRRGKARYADTLMDERLIVDGKVIDFDGAFYDDNLNGLEWWKNKHRGYAKREAEQALTLFDCSDCSSVRMKTGIPLDPRKVAYYKLPRYLRAVMYFCIRYFLKGGFLDGKAGWMWNFWQGLWYRWIVDREIGRRLKVEG